MSYVDITGIQVVIFSRYGSKSTSAVLTLEAKWKHNEEYIRILSTLDKVLESMTPSTRQAIISAYHEIDGSNYTQLLTMTLKRLEASPLNKSTTLDKWRDTVEAILFPYNIFREGIYADTIKKLVDGITEEHLDTASMVDLIDKSSLFMA